MKNGQEIDVSRTNLIISSEGSLLFSQVSLSDLGNYSCGARNLFAQRISGRAQLIVYSKSTFVGQLRRALNMPRALHAAGQWVIFP